MELLSIKCDDGRLSVHDRGEHAAIEILTAGEVCGKGWNLDWRQAEAVRDALTNWLGQEAEE